MPISATGNKKFGNGFTLVELMVVIAIIGITTAIVSLSLPDPQGRLTDEAETFAARAIATRDNAIIESRDMSLWITRNGYGIERRRRGQWQPVSERPFEPMRFNAGTSAIVGATGRQRVAFDTTGAIATPVTVTLVRDSARATVTFSGDGAIRVGS